jgi:hypothetical protein
MQEKRASRTAIKKPHPQVIHGVRVEADGAVALGAKLAQLCLEALRVKPVPACRRGQESSASWHACQQLELAACSSVTALPVLWHMPHNLMNDCCFACIMHAMQPTITHAGVMPFKQPVFEATSLHACPIRKNHQPAPRLPGTTVGGQSGTYSNMLWEWVHLSPSGQSTRCKTACKQVVTIHVDAKQLTGWWAPCNLRVGVQGEDD